MAHITLQFCGFKSLFGRIIAWGTEGQVGHVDAVFAGGLLGAQHQDGLGGEPGGVHIRPSDYLATCGGRNIVRVTIRVTEAQRQKFDAFLRAQIGKPYDVKGILGFLVGKNWRSPHAWFCSELIAAALEHAGIFPYPLFVWKNRVTPQELLLITSTLGTVEAVAA